MALNLTTGLQRREDGESVEMGFLQYGNMAPRSHSEMIRQQYATSGLTRQLACLLAFASTLVLALLIALVVSHVGGGSMGETRSSTDGSSKVCLTASCVRVAGEILSNMNLSADPCDDFYEYACGHWPTVNLPPPDKPKWTNFNKLYRRNLGLLKQILDKGDITLSGANSTALAKSVAYYKACMESSNGGVDKYLATFKNILRQIGVGTLPIEGVSGGPAGALWDAHQFNLSRSLGTLNGLNVDLLLDYFMAADDKNSSVTVFKLKQRGITLRSEMGYNKSSNRAAFLAYATRALSLLGAPDDKHQTILLMEEIWELEADLAAIYVPRENLRDPKVTYNKWELSKINSIMSRTGLDILSLMEGKYGTKMSPSDTVVVVTADYLHKLPGVLLKYLSVDKRHVLANYLAWSVVDAFCTYAGTEFRAARLELDRVESGVQSLSPAWELCVGRTDGSLSMAVGVRYVDLQFSREDKETMESMLSYVREAYTEHFPTLAWMDSTTQARAVEKVKAIDQKLGYPEWIKNQTKLDEHYRKLSVTDDNQLTNVLNSLTFSLLKDKDKIGKPPDRKKWQMTPSEVNAYYEPSFNQIVFPAGVLQNPFYDPDFPMLLNFAAGGSVIGHEVSHGFDDQGSLYDKWGNLATWWTQESSQRFMDRSQCMADQYSQYTILGNKVNGNLTLGENIADNGGLKIAMLAYRKWESDHQVEPPLPGLGATPEQLFFLGYSQMWCSYYQPAYALKSLQIDFHSPNRYRVNGVMSNSPQFAEAYHCPVGSTMNPEKKCTVW